MATSTWRHMGIDHLTVCVPRDIEKVVEHYVRHMHGRVVFKNLDVMPRAKSSLILYGIACDDAYLVAIAQGIDREEKSHVTLFCEKNPIHGLQHAALRVSNLYTFVEEKQAEGIPFMGEIHKRRDAFGDVLQIFAAAWDGYLPVAQASFYEFVQRPEGWRLSPETVEIFTDETAEELSDDLERARWEGRQESFFGDLFCVNYMLRL